MGNEHWKKYGRNYYARYDYEGVDKGKAEEMMKAMADKSGQLVGQEFGGMKMAQNDMFEYHDPAWQRLQESGYSLHLRRQVPHHFPSVRHRRCGCDNPSVPREVYGSRRRPRNAPVRGRE